MRSIWRPDPRNGGRRLDSLKFSQLIKSLNFAPLLTPNQQAEIRKDLADYLPMKLIGDPLTDAEVAKQSIPPGWTCQIDNSTVTLRKPSTTLGKTEHRIEARYNHEVFIDIGGPKGVLELAPAICEVVVQAWLNEWRDDNWEHFRLPPD